jgi:lysozyme
VNIEALLIREEGFNPSAYQDHLGFWTIGYGTLIDERKGAGLTEEEALYLMRNRVKDMRKGLEKRVPWLGQLNESRQTVLLAMAFQMGVDGVIGFKNTLEALRLGDWAKAARGIRGSKWAQQTPGRAERMAKAIETGELV